MELQNEFQDNTELDNFLKILDENNLLRTNFDNPYKSSLVEKQIYYLDGLSKNCNISQKRLEDSCVAILGLGGSGSILIQNLVGAGVSHFILIDFDSIDISNLNRQFIYNAKQLHLKKTDAAKQYIESINTNATVVTIDTIINRVDDLHILDSYDISIFANAADQPNNIESIVNEYCLQHSIPSISCGCSVSK